jgi:hypothetical protein
MERRLFFLLKCAFWLSLVFMAISWSRPEVSATLERPVLADNPAARGRKKGRAAPKFGADSNGFFSSVSNQAADQLAVAVRRHCLERPRDCVDAIDSLREGLTRGAHR